MSVCRKQNSKSVKYNLDLYTTFASLAVGNLALQKCNASSQKMKRRSIRTKRRFAKINRRFTQSERAFWFEGIENLKIKWLH